MTVYLGWVLATHLPGFGSGYPFNYNVGFVPGNRFIGAAQLAEAAMPGISQRQRD